MIDISRLSGEPEPGPHRNLVIVDGTLKWCLYYHHDGLLSLARGRDFNATAD